MVNTRRKESAPEPELHRYHTRKHEPVPIRKYYSSDFDHSQREDGEEQEANDPDVSRDNSEIENRTTRFSSLKRFTGGDRFGSRHGHQTRSSTTVRRKLTVFKSGRKMCDDISDSYSPSARRYDHHKQRRTALSLRPITRKSYNDNRYLSESDTNEGLRRSLRNASRRKNYSWLVDDEMHKVGYPNLRSREYFEEDSRDAEVEDNNQMGSNGTYSMSNGTTRHSHFRRNYNKENKESTLNAPKEDSESNSNSDVVETDQKPKVQAESTSTRRSTRVVKVVARKEEDATDEDDDNDEEQQDNNDVTVATNDTKGDSNKDKRDSSDSETRHNRSRIMTRRRMILNSTRSNRNQKRATSSSSEVSRKGYSLRDRNKTVSRNASIISPAIRPQRRRRRKASPASSSSSSSGDEKYPTHSKYSKSNTTKGNKTNAAGTSKIAPIRPEQLDGSIRFSSVGGLDSHVQCLKEMILLPMMYPEVFKRFEIQPPRGVLFHGPPGTGKTLIARALANECSFGSRKVSFFMRKGADLLCKWVGESEKQLQMLFQQATELQPSIIFFDELDGLAPVRSSRQDQFHASIVSTLLALMDGLNHRGEVIVIGATNRIDAIDPALRRPGRFDRELYFPLPARKEREEILKVHVGKWHIAPSEHILSYLAENSVGYCGSDLRALCTEAVIQSFRRTYPQVYSSDHRLQLNPENVKVEKIDFMRAKSTLIPASHRVTRNLGRKLLPVLAPLLNDSLQEIKTIINKYFPHGGNPSLAKVKLSTGVKPAQLLIIGDSPDYGQSSHVCPALLQHMEHIHAHLLDISALHCQTGISMEEACIQIFHEAKRSIPSIIYVPGIDTFWNLATEALKAIFLSEITTMDPNLPILILATADIPYDSLDDQVQQVFSPYRNEIFVLPPPKREQRLKFLRPLFEELAVKPPRVRRALLRTPSPLPLAPTPPPPPLSPTAEARIFETEERTLRELRIFLRDMCKKLANNRLFFTFTKPVDTDEVPDYKTIIKEPMDLETMMTKVDMHSYTCADDFLRDIDLIVQNALEYNPAKTSADKQIRHRANSLRDYAFTLFKNEMDSDFEDKCQDISKRRKERKVSVTQYLPPYLQTAEQTPGATAAASTDKAAPEKAMRMAPTGATASSSSRSSSARKRFRWQQGYIKKRKRSTGHSATHSASKDDHNIANETKASDNDSDQDEEEATLPMEIENVKTVTMKELTIDIGPIPVTPSNKELPDGCKTESLASPRCKRKLSNLLSPSELLNVELEFDDIDQALNEDNYNADEVATCKEMLNQLLQVSVDVTDGLPVQTLLDFHQHLKRVIQNYSASCNRQNLTRDLEEEIGRFKDQLESSENV